MKDGEQYSVAYNQVRISSMHASIHSFIHASIVVVQCSTALSIAALGGSELQWHPIL
jgi:hypothetical protein